MFRSTGKKETMGTKARRKIQQEISREIEERRKRQEERRKTEEVNNVIEEDTDLNSFGK